MTSLAERFAAVCAEDSDIQHHLPWFAELVVDMKARTVIECGVRSGRSSTAWLHGLEQTDGHLWSVDLDPAPFDHPRWSFMQDDDLAPQVMAFMPLIADIVFIDTSHWFDHTIAEIAAYYPSVRPGGVMLFHDTDLPEYEVRPALDECFGTDGWENRPGSSGLGIVRVPT